MSVNWLTETKDRKRAQIGQHEPILTSSWLIDYVTHNDTMKWLAKRYPKGLNSVFSLDELK